MQSDRSNVYLNHRWRRLRKCPIIPRERHKCSALWRSLGLVDHPQTRPPNRVVRFLKHGDPHTATKGRAFQYLFLRQNKKCLPPSPAIASRVPVDRNTKSIDHYRSCAETIRQSGCAKNRYCNLSFIPFTIPFKLSRLSLLYLISNAR